jgi:hypothetical protein
MMAAGLGDATGRNGGETLAPFFMSIIRWLPAVLAIRFRASGP